MKFAPLCLALSGPLLAFPGLNSSQGLHHVQGARTSGDEYLNLSLGLSATDGTQMIAGGQIRNLVDGQLSSVSQVQKLYSASYLFGASLGIDQDWDAGIVLPVLHDHVQMDQVSANLSQASKASLGDLRFWTKHRLPVFAQKSLLALAVSAEASMNTGSEQIGLIPKELHVLPQNAQQKTSPHTAGVSTFGAGLALSIGGAEVKKAWSYHASLGLRRASYLDLSGISLWGVGAEYDWKHLGVFGEYSGETRWNMGMLDDPQRLGLGGRLFGSNWNLSVQGEFNPSYNHLARTITLDADVVDVESSQYTLNTSNPWSLSAVWSWKIDLIGDEDQDGVRNHQDLCAKTPRGVAVDGRGCEFDADADGIVDRLDQCAQTPAGRKVDARGCELDGDRDGVVDALDQCAETPAGRKVDERGCELDADADGVVDALDQCAQTPAKAQVDSTGCELDKDHDGVVDALDQCAGTPANRVVDSTGCEPDSDHDRIPDVQDLCPATPEARTVDSTGCELDGDHDGVVDALDQCPASAVSAKVNAQGCVPEVMRDLSKLQSAIHFQTGSAILLSSSIPALDQVVRLIESLGEVKLRIEGHTDNVGKAEMNLKLSQDRAQAVKDYLVAKGIKAENLAVQGFGSQKPIDRNDTPAGRAKNRRTEINPMD